MPRRRKISMSSGEKLPAVTENVKNKKKGKSAPVAKKARKEPEWLTEEGKLVIQLILSIQKSECNSSNVMKELSKLYTKVCILTPSNRLSLTTINLEMYYFRSDEKPLLILSSRQFTHFCFGMTMTSSLRES